MDGALAVLALSARKAQCKSRHLRIIESTVTATGSRTKPDAARTPSKQAGVNFADILASKRVLVVLGVPSMTSNVGISMSINTQLARSILHSHTK